MRDLEKDLEICKAASYVDGMLKPEDTRFITECRTAWPKTIRYAMKLEKEIDRLREENAMLLEQLNQRGCGL